MMDWSIQHLTSSPRFPHSNAHAEKAVGIVKELYTKCHDIKLGLLLLKTTPVTNGHHSYQAPANVFLGHQLKANLPLYHSSSSQNTCTLDTENSAGSDINLLLLVKLPVLVYSMNLNQVSCSKETYLYIYPISYHNTSL